jgi:DNA-3-methyladenine glycosylase
MGVDLMLERRKKKKLSDTLINGPGSLCQALGITKKHNGLSLDGSKIWLEDKGIIIAKKNILALPRVGINYAEEDALKPWRFVYTP